MHEMPGQEPDVDRRWVAGVPADHVRVVSAEPTSTRVVAPSFKVLNGAHKACGESRLGLATIIPLVSWLRMRSMGVLEDRADHRARSRPSRARATLGEPLASGPMSGRARVGLPEEMKLSLVVLFACVGDEEFASGGCLGLGCGAGEVGEEFGGVYCGSCVDVCGEGE